MATDIVGSLFGVTPEMFQQRQAALADKQAIEFAQLTPIQQAQAGIYRGAYGLAGALGGALGAQDPQLQLISTRNSIARQIDYSSPMSIMEGQRTLARLGDTVGALQLANVARDLEYKQAQTSQSLAAAGASRAQAAKSQAEIDEIARQEKAFAALTGKAPAAEATPAADAAPAALGPRTETLLDRAGEPYTVEIGGAISAPVGVMQNIPPSGVMGAPAAAAPAAAAPAQTRATLNQQIAALERQRAQMLALTKVPAAKAEAEVLGDQIKDLRSQLKPTELTNLEREIQQLRSEGVPDTDPRIRTRLDKITKLSSSSAERFGVDREAISQEVYDKPFAQLTQPQRAAVNKRVEDEQGRRAKAGAAVFPGDKALVDIPAFRASVQRTIAPQLSTITASKQALQSINDSIATNNFVSFNAARTQLARSLGDSQLSRRDIEQAGGDPSILGSLIDLTSRAFTSTPSIDTQRKIRSTLQAIETVARKQARGEVDQQRKIALRSPGYDAEAVNEALMFPELQGDAVMPAAVTGGDLAAAAAAELARRRGGK
jgi:hypothetical protein